MKHILAILDRLDAVENDERSVLDDDGVDALIDLHNARDDIRKLITLALQISDRAVPAGADSTGQEMVKLRRALLTELRLALA